MMISELIAELERLEDLLGDLPVELDSGSVVRDVDMVSDSDKPHEPVVAVVIK